MLSGESEEAIAVFTCENGFETVLLHRLLVCFLIFLGKSARRGSISGPREAKVVPGREFVF